MNSIKYWFSLVLTIALLSISTVAMANEYKQTIELFQKAAAVKPFFKEAYGYAVFPSVGKGGIIIGGAYGFGRVYENKELTGTAILKKISIGLQLGGQAFSEIIFFQDKRSYNEFVNGNYEFDGSVSAVIVTAAAQAQASTHGNTAGANLGSETSTQAETDYTKGMAVFVHTLGGAMLEISVGGQTFSFEPI